MNMNMKLNTIYGNWTTRGYANSRTGQLADATGDFACLVFVLLAASASPRVVQSATCPVRELAIRELAYPRVVQLPCKRCTSYSNSVRPSVCRLSSVTLVRPTQAVQIFRNILRHLVPWPSVDIH